MIDEVFAFPDSNILLHYKPLAQIDWCGLLDAGAVILVICVPVIKELDQKKSDTRLSDRARRAIKEIEEHESASKPLRPGVRLELYNQKVRRDEFPECLSPDSQDDCIIHLVKKYEAQRPDRKICVLSEDYGMKLSCRASSLAVHQPDAGDRLENPGDEKDKRIKQLQAEVATLKNRLPKLSLRFLVPGQDLRSDEPYSSKLVDNWVPLDKAVELERQRRAHPKRSEQLADPKRSERAFPHLTSAARIFEQSVTEDQWKRYDGEVDSYLADYEIFLGRYNTWGSNRARTFQFVVPLQNAGSGPATNIDVILRFPPRVAWLAAEGTDKARLLMKPEPPTPPERPKPSIFSVTDALGSLGMSRIHDIPALRDLALGPRYDPDEPDVEVDLRPEEGHIVHAKLGRLKHAQAVILGPFFGVFRNWADVYPFEVEYTLSANELPDQPTGKVGLQVRRVERQDDASGRAIPAD